MALRQVVYVTPSGHTSWRYVDVGARSAKLAHGGVKTLPAGGGSLRVKAGAS